MAKTNLEPDNSSPLAGSEGKRPYTSPQILYREKLEVIASVCAPAPPAKANPGQCPQGPISS